ncbi:MAG: signal peptide peptidase SppA [Acidobacteriaceae bacterium]|nr:signal peptide peptidase SppA [Acidobacteriaceae bacterium]
MWKFLLGVLIGIVVTVVGLFVIALAVGRLLQTKQPSVAENSALVLKLKGEIPEEAPIEVPIPFLEQQSAPTVRDLWTSLHQAANDTRIKAVVLQPRGLVAGWGKLQELRQDVLDFKRSGKPVYAYLQNPGSREYYLATAADKIFLSPDDGLNIKGFLLQMLYFKNTLDKLGVQFQVDHIGRFKDAGDIYTRTGMSPETREVYSQVLDQIYGDFCTTIAQSRHKTPDDIRSLIDMGPFLATQAKAAGLIDTIGYEEEVYSDLKNRVGVGDLNKTGIHTYFRAAPGRGDRIALLVGEGEIVGGEPPDSVGGQAEIASGAFTKLIRQVRNDSGVKGVILRVDSPGGDAIASDEILHELKLLSKAKPLVISMSDVAASGGYFISMTGNPVLAYPDTITGSIGVLYARPNFRGLFDKVGVSEDSLTRGKLADMDALDQPLSDAALQKLHEQIEATYKSFVSKVAAARNKSFVQIDTVAQGRVWMGAQADQNGLVDQLGGFDQAVALVRKEAKLPPSGETNLVMYPPRRSLIDILTNFSPETSDGDAAQSRLREIESAAAQSKLRELFPNLPGAALLKGGLLRILPYRFEVH